MYKPIFFIITVLILDIGVSSVVLYDYSGASNLSNFLGLLLHHIDITCR